MMTNYLFGIIAFGGSHNGGGETPESVRYYSAFPMEIIVFRFAAGIVSTLFIWCDECRRP
jgi:hypothetical protein